MTLLPCDTYADGDPGEPVDCSELSNVDSLDTAPLSLCESDGEESAEDSDVTNVCTYESGESIWCRGLMS